MLSRGQSIIQTPVTPLCPLFASAVRTSLTEPQLHHRRFHLSQNSSPGAESDPLSKPCHPALTFLRAESPREIPADELLEMLKTARLGSVTGNVQGLVSADISDRSLSSREGLTLISSRLSLCSATSETCTRWGWVAMRIPKGLSSVVCSRKTDRRCEGRLFLAH